MDFVPAPTEVNGASCNGKKTRCAICRVSEWKDVAELRQILFVLTYGPR